MSRRVTSQMATGLVLLVTGCAGEETSACGLDDADGVKGGAYRFEVTVDDTGFSPTSIFAVQNYATVDLTLTNRGSIDRGLVVECLPTPNDDGCAQESCVSGASIELIPPGDTKSIQFTVPAVEGLYDVTTGVPGDSVSGQFVIQ